MLLTETKISLQWSTTIPKEVRPWLKAKKGESIEWHVENGDIKIKKKK